MRNNTRRRLISHLSLNHLLLTGRGNASLALTEILRLYGFKDSAINTAQIGSIARVNTGAISAPALFYQMDRTLLMIINLLLSFCFY